MRVPGPLSPLTQKCRHKRTHNNYSPKFLFSAEGKNMCSQKCECMGHFFTQIFKLAQMLS